MSDHSGISRRSFFAGAGLAAGAGLTAGGFAAFTPLSAQAAAATGGRSYSQLAVAVEIDGAPAGFASAADGGGLEVKFSSEAVGSTKLSNNKFAGLSVDPLTLRFASLAGAKFPEWFAARDNVPRNVVVSLVETANLSEIYRVTLNRARLAGIRTQSFDALSGERTVLETDVQLVAESVIHEVTLSKRRTISSSIKGKTPSIASFRLFFAGLEQSTPTIFKIESVATLTDRIATVPGPNGSTTIPTGIWKPEPIKFRVLLDGAAGFYQWFNTPSEKKSGQLQWLTLDLQVPATIDFFGAVVRSISSPFSLSANGGSLPAVDVEVVCDDMRFNYGGLFT